MSASEKAGLLWFLLVVTYSGPTDGLTGFFLFLSMLVGVGMFLSGGAIEIAIKEWNKEEK